MSNVSPTRRSLLGMALAGVAGNLGASASGNRFLVSIYLLGGSGGDSLIVPLEDGLYRRYKEIRGRLALSARELLRVRGAKNPGEYGFHPAAQELRDLYNRGALAVVANVGSPRTAGDTAGHDYRGLTFLPGGAFTLSFAAAHAGVTITDSDRALVTDRGVSLVPLSGSALRGRREMAHTAGAIVLQTRFPETSLGRALMEVAGLIPAARATGTTSALITVPMGGFHSRQPAEQGALFRELSDAMGAFYAATEELGISRDVTAFTDSEFGRSLAPNKSGGAGPGWGNHHLVMGRSVLGGDIYGEFPKMAAARDAVDGWIPITSRDQYLGTLAGWAGVRVSGWDGNLGFMA